MRPVEAEQIPGGSIGRGICREISTLLSDLNAIHACREGNGRTQLSFFLLLADQTGHSVDLERFDPDAFIAAMITSFGGDEAPLAATIVDLVGD